MGEDDPPPAMEGTARLFVRVVATPASVAPAPRVDAPEEPTKADPADAWSEKENEAETANDDVSDDDPVDQSLTIAYVLPDDNEHASDAFSIPATRKSGAACAVKWDGPESGHELAVNEQTMRAYAARPRVAFTITREAPPVVPVPGDGDGGDAGTEGEPAQPPTEDDPTSPARGEPIVSVVEVELASVMLGSRRAATVMFGEKHFSSDDAEVFRLSAPPMPEALRGFAWATITVSLDAFLPDENESGSTEPEKEAEKEKTAFLPPGLASAMEPFAVTVETATSLPEAPATRDDLSLCAPVKCLVRWAGMPVATMEATFGETDWVASLDADGGSGSSAFETKRFPDGKANDVHEKKKKKASRVRHRARLPRRRVQNARARCDVRQIRDLVRV